MSVSFEIGDPIGTIRCATQNVSIYSDSLAEGPESFIVIMTLDSSRYESNPVASTVVIDDEDDGNCY